MPPQIGQLVKSMAHETLGYLHHTTERGMAWVSDNQDGSSGQFYYLSDLVAAQ